MASIHLFGNIHTFNNFESAGTPVLVPDVQNYQAKSEVVTLPKPFTVTIPAEEAIILEQLQTELKRFPGMVATSSPEGFCQFVLQKENTPAHPQGYTIDVDSHGIRIASRTTIGLYWGAQTLRNLIRNTAKPTLTACHIDDYPDFDRRGLFFTMRYFPKEDMAQLKQMFDACATLKINWLMMDFSECFPYSNYEFVLPRQRRAFTRQELTEIRDYCRKLHLEITPVLQVLSHAEWMSYHPDWKSMRESAPWGPWGNEACPWNEQARKITEMAIDEQIEFFQPDSFNIMMDEIQECTFRQCPKCKATDPKVTMMNYMAFAQQAVCKHHVHPIACYDPFYSRPGWEFGDDLRELVKHDMGFMWWAYTDKLQPEREKILQSFQGQRLIGHALSGKPLNIYNVAHKLKQLGCREINLPYWYFGETGTFYKYAWENPESYGGIVTGADYLWKLTQKHYADFSYDACYEMQRRLHPQDITLPQREGTAQPLPLEQIVNADLSVSVKYPSLTSQQTAELANSLSALPERFRLVTADDGHYYGLRLSGSKDQPNALLEAELPLHGCQTKQLSLLLTASKPDDMADYISAPTYGKKRHKQPAIATLTLLYDDGSTVEKPLRYRFEISDWNRAFGGFGLRNAVRGTDTLQRFYTFGILDVINPHPNKKLQSLKLTSLGVDGIEPVLLAISIWGTPSLKQPQSEPFHPALMGSHRYPAHDDSRAPIVLQEDFETWQGDVVTRQNIPNEFKVWKQALGKVFIISGGSFEGKVEAEVIPDPLEPARGHVLHIHIPKAPAIGTNRWSRISVLIPYTPDKDTQCLTFAHRITSKKGYSRTQDYLIGSDDKTPNRVWGVPLKTDWKTIFHPTVSGYKESTLDDITQTCVRNISYFFDYVEDPIDLYIDAIGDSKSIHSDPVYWTIFSDYDPI